MANQIQASGAVKIRSLTGALTASAGVVTSVPLGAANGVATLDALGKVPLSQLPASVVTYLGTWNAATNTPTLANGTGDVGDLYICNVAGTVNFGAGPITFAVGDWVIYSGTTWQKSSGASGTVTSVAATVPTGLTVTGSPITTSGTLAFSLTAGYTIPLSTQLVPSGGTAGQLLAKNSATNYDTAWIDNYTEQLRDTVKAAVAINKGQAVYISGANGTNQIVSLASNASEATSSKTLGLAAQNFAINDIGQIITEGLLAGIDTSTATAGDPVWLGVDGNLIFGLTNKPVAPAHLVYIGVVTRVQAINGEIYIKIQNGFELQELHNVLITSPANGNILQYDSATSLWKNVAGTTTNIAEGTNLYYTDARARLALSATTPLSYNNTTGVFSISQANTTTDGYLSSTDWNTFNGKQGALTLTTTGTSGAATLVGNTLNIPNYAPDLSGYVTLATNQTITGFKTFSNTVTSNATIFLNDVGSLTNYVKVQNAGAFMDYRPSTIVMNDRQSVYTKTLTFKSNILTASYDIVLPDASGTVALTSNLSSYLPLTGGTLTTSVGNTLTIINSGTGYGLYVQAGAAYFQNGASIQGSATLVSVTASSMLKTNASGVISAAVAGTDYQAPLTNPVTGTGTTNYIPKWSGTGTLNGSSIYQGATGFISIGNTNSTYNLDVTGTGRFSSSVGIGALPGANGLFEVSNNGTGVTVGDFLVDAANKNVYVGRLSSTSNDNTNFIVRNRIGTAALYVVGNSGNVGIGTTNTTARLNVQATSNYETATLGTATGTMGYLSANGLYGMYIGIGNSGNTWLQSQRNDGTTSAYNLLLNPAGGDVLINSTSTSSGAKFNVFFSDATNNGAVFRETTGNASVGYIIFNSNGTQTGSITRNGSSNAVLYNTSSDYRLKEDLKEFNGLELISKIKTYDFKWKNSEDRMNGVLAHELAKILPYAVSGEKDALDKDGNIKPQGVDYSMIVSVLVKAIQEQQEIITNLQERILILEK